MRCLAFEGGSGIGDRVVRRGTGHERLSSGAILRLLDWPSSKSDWVFS